MSTQEADGVMVEMDTKSQLIVTGFVRDAEKLFVNKIENSYFNIPLDISYLLLLYYNSIPLTIKNAICTKQFLDENEDPLKLISIRYIESYRWQIYQKHFDLISNQSVVSDGKHFIFAVECISKDSDNNESQEIDEQIVIAADIDNKLEIQVIELEDKVSMEDLSPSKLVEYTFDENGSWYLSSLSLRSLKYYKKAQFKNWKRTIEAGDDMLTFRRLLKVGLLTNIHDHIAFPISEDAKSDWIVVAQNGNTIELPRCVHALRVWSCKQRCYIPIDPHLDDAPNERNADKYWNDMLDKFREQYDAQCIDNTLNQEWGGRGPKHHCFCEYC